MDTIELKVENVLKQYDGDKEEALLHLHFSIKHCSDRFEMRVLVMEYNRLVDSCNAEDFQKGYKKMIL
jgi:hypothetical protein